MHQAQWLPAHEAIHFIECFTEDIKICLEIFFQLLCTLKMKLFINTLFFYLLSLLDVFKIRRFSNLNGCVNLHFTLKTLFSLTVAIVFLEIAFPKEYSPFNQNLFIHTFLRVYTNTFTRLHYYCLVSYLCN